MADAGFAHRYPLQRWRAGCRTILRDLDEELNAAGVHIAFAEMRARLQDLVKRYGLHTTLDEEHFYPSLERALVAITSGLD